MTAFRPQTRFLQQWSIEAESVGRNERKAVALNRNDHLERK